MINKLKKLIDESEDNVSKGIQLDRQSLVNYIENVLGLNVVNVELIDDELSIYDVYEITAEKDDNKYEFIGEYYNFHEVKSRENMLTLKEIAGKEGVYETDETFYLSNENVNKKSRLLLETPLSDLIEGVNVDRELEFALDILKKNLSEVQDYEFSRSSPNSRESFEMKLPGVRITLGFSNTFQVEFENSPLQFIQVIFRDLDKDEVTNKINSLCNLIKNYVKDSIGNSRNISINGHSISLLMEVFWDKIQGKVNTSLLVDEFNGDKGILVNNFVLGGYGSYKQFEVKISYDFIKDNFVVNVDYLFDKEEMSCDSVYELIDLIEDLEGLVK